jgi:hypothetical protein
MDCVGGDLIAVAQKSEAGCWNPASPWDKALATVPQNASAPGWKTQLPPPSTAAVISKTEQSHYAASVLRTHETNRDSEICRVMRHSQAHPS